MSVSIKILNCHGSCRNCYQWRIRRRNPSLLDYDFNAILREVRDELEKIKKDRTIRPPTLHGGEPLMMRNEEIAILFSEIYEVCGCSGIQTSLDTMTDEHVEMFKRFRTNVGVSIDGDSAELNHGRLNEKDERVRGRAIERVLENIGRIAAEKVNVSIISLLRRYNGTGEGLHAFIRFQERMRTRFGITDVRINPCIVFEDENREEELTAEEFGKAMVRLAEIVLGDESLTWLPFRDIVEMMFGYDHATCNFRGCDPWRTSGDVTILGDGSRGNCQKTGAAVDGILSLRADSQSFARQEVLKQISQSRGGCEGCRYWVICKGGCPGEGFENDWRRKTRFCEGWKASFRFIEKRITGMIPNVFTSPYLKTIDVENSQMNLGAEGSTWRKERRKEPKDLKAKATKGANVQHGDRPYADHTDLRR